MISDDLFSGLTFYTPPIIYAIHYYTHVYDSTQRNTDRNAEVEAEEPSGVVKKRGKRKKGKNNLLLFTVLS